MSPVRVDFYILSHNDTDSLLGVVCRLLEKAYQTYTQSYVCCTTEAEAQQLDELLWSYQDIAFLPHARADSSETILIGCSDKIPNQAELIINLTPKILHRSAELKRIIELVPNDETAKSISREHYRSYRTSRYELYSHNLSL